MVNPITVFRFILNKGKALGQSLAYTALLLYHTYRKPETPIWAKRVVLGALAYLIAPIDSIPDLTPLLGFTDDMGVLSFALVTIACYVDDSVKEKARVSTSKIFKNIDDKVINEVNDQL